jgi:hypothetical protein
LTDVIYARSMTTPKATKTAKTITTLRSVTMSDRRRRRTEDVMEALHMQLDACRADAELTAMIVADEHGMCLAASGEVMTCSEIAARLPMLGRKAGDFDGVLLGAKGGVPVAMKRIRIDGAELFACALGGVKERHAMQLVRAEQGVRRILAA